VKKLEYIKEYFYYSVAFFMCLAILILPFLIHNMTFIHVGDTSQQHYPAFIYMGRYLQGLLRGEFHLYDFSIGYGEDIIESLNYYGFGDPVNLLSVFVTDTNAALLFAILMFVRIYLSGVGMVRYLGYHGYHGLLPAGGAVIYAFSLFSINQGLWFYPFLSAMYLFPFLVVQMEKLLSSDRTSKDGFVFAVLIAIQSCCGFYFLYFQTILMGIYWLIFYCMDRKYTSRDTFLNNAQKVEQFLNGIRINITELLRYVFVYYIAGMFLAAPVLLPALHGFFQSARNIGNREGWRFIFSLEDYQRFFANLLIPLVDADGYSLAIPMVSMFALAYYFWGMQGRLKGKILIVSGFVMYLCPVFWRLMNGFSYGVDRWIYFVYFVIAYITVDAMTNLKREGIIQQCVLIAICILNICSLLYHDKIYFNDFRIILYLYIIVDLGVALVLLLGKRNEFLIYCLILGTVLLNIVSVSLCCRSYGQRLFEIFCDNSIKEAFYTEDNNAQESEWSRRDVYSSFTNEGMVKGYNGTSEYLSIANGNVADFYLQFLISPGIRVSLWNLWGLDQREPLQALLGADQEHPLPIGIFYNEAISETDFQRIRAIEKQNLILHKVILDEVKLTDNSSGKDMSMKELFVKKEYSNVNENVFTPDSSILLTIDTSELKYPGELYVFIKGLRCYGYDYGLVRVGEKEIAVCNDQNSRYYRDEEDFLVRLEGDYGNTIKIQFMSNIQYTLDDIEVYWNDEGKIKEAVKALKKRSMQDVHQADDLITGKIRTDQDGWLFLSVPYSNNWEICVDGERVEAIRANIGFTAVFVGKGEHMIVLKYRPIWFYFGIVLSGLTGMWYMGAALYRKVCSVKFK